MTGGWDMSDASNLFLTLKKQKRGKVGDLLHVHENQRLRKRKGQSHWLNKSKPVQRRQTICNKTSIFLNTFWWKASLQKCIAFCSAKCHNLLSHFFVGERQKQRQSAKHQFFLWLLISSTVAGSLSDLILGWRVTKKKKKTALNPFCFYNRDHTGGKLSISWTFIFHVYASRSYILLPLWHLFNSCIIFTLEGRKNPLEGIQKDEKGF